MLVYVFCDLGLVLFYLYFVGVFMNTMCSKKVVAVVFTILIALSNCHAMQNSSHESANRQLLTGYLFAAAKIGNVDLIYAMLRQGVDGGARDALGYTPGHYLGLYFNDLNKQL